MLIIREFFVNDTENRSFGEGDWYEPYTDNLSELYRSLRSEYGRCIGKVYIDTPDGTPDAIGWIFCKRMVYEGARKPYQKSDYYTRHVWVTYQHALNLKEAQRKG
jgi:hypothetical protein